MNRCLMCGLPWNRCKGHGRVSLEPREREIRVFQACDKDWVDERTVEVLDISEDMQGRDRLLFKCPACGESHESYRR